MSLAINVSIPGYQILASDSRASYRNQKGQARVGSDSASKLFKLGTRVGVTATGPAFLPENDVQKNISKFIEDFKQANDIEKLTTKEIANKLHAFFDKKYPYREQLAKLPDQIKADLKQKGLELIEIKSEKNTVKFRFKDKDGNIKTGAAGVNQLSFIVAGYSDGNHEVWIAYIPGELQLKRSGKEKGKEYGAAWTGQIDVVVRIILGRDPRIRNLPFVQKAIKEISEKGVFKQLSGLEYAISWGTMNVNDAINFCKLAIETTAAIQQFSDGIIADPGDIPGVGGPVDVAVITPNKGFVWVSKKNLRIERVEVDLDKLPDLPPAKPKKKKK